MPDQPGTAPDHLRVTMSAEAVSVPAVRRFVADGLAAWDLTALADEVVLCVSELAGNAALHSASPFMHVDVRRVEGGVRVGVEDEGAVPVRAVVPRPSFPGPDVNDELLLEDESTTGRGLGIVSVLARSWGVEELPGGKRVWFEITGTDEEFAVREPVRNSVDDVPQSGAMLPDGWTRVRLAGCPVRLSLRQDEHLDELVRELQLVGSEEANAASQALAVELRDLLTEPAHARHLGRRVAQRAAADGLEHVDVDMVMPRAFSFEVEKLDVAVKAADVHCAERRLLTLASSAEMRELRAWMTDQVVRQLRYAEEPVPWEDWLARRSALA